MVTKIELDKVIPVEYGELERAFMRDIAGVVVGIIHSQYLNVGRVDLGAYAYYFFIIDLLISLVTVNLPI
jgi:hypothetical protein